MTPPLPEHRLLMDADGGEDLLPEPGLVLVHDDEGQQAGIDHLHQIFIFQRLRGGLDVDKRFSRRLVGLVVGREALEVAGGGAHVDPLAGQIGGALHLGRGRSRDEQFPHVLEQRIGKEHPLQFAPLGDGEVGGGDVALACDEGFQQGLARYRDEDQVQLEMALEALLLAQLLVEPLLHLDEGVVGDAPLHPLVDEIAGLVVGGEHPDGAPCQHGIEIAKQGLGQLVAAEGQGGRLGLGFLCGGGLRCGGGLQRAAQQPAQKDP